MSVIGERPRSVGPMRAAAILYGDWGTSKAYVLGIAFAVAGYSSFPLLCAMAVLTALVGLNYYFVCTQYPDGGGVYSAVRERSRLFACIGALLLIADYLVTASLSVLEGFNYLSHLMEAQFGHGLPRPDLLAILLILFLGGLNWWGPRHSGSLAVLLAVPASVAAISIALVAAPHLGEATFTASDRTPWQNWGMFAGIVLALSGVEAVSNMTGVMVPDKEPDKAGHATVKRTSKITIGLVATEVVVLTVILGWAMHATPGLDRTKTDAMLGQMAEHFGRLSFGDHFGTLYGSLVGLVMALLLFSAGNTAIIGMVSVFYMMASDREMPAPFGKLNRHGVPTFPLLVATVLPCVLLIAVNKVEGLAALYAIGVVGAITINLGACASNKHLHLTPLVRTIMGTTAVVMLAIWITIGYEKREALIFAITILAFGLVARSFVQERREKKAEDEMREVFTGSFELPPHSDEPRVMVSLRGVTDTLRFAVEEARMRNGRLGVLFVREVNVIIPAAARMSEDKDAVRIFEAAKSIAGDVPIEFLYRTSDDASATIVKTVNEWKADFLVIGASAEGTFTQLVRGSIIQTLTASLPARTRLLIYSWRPEKSKKAKAVTDTAA